MLFFCAGCMHTQRVVVPHPPALATVRLAPAEVTAGEPIAAAASAEDFPATNRLTYTWNSTGGKLVINEATATIDTTGLAAGDYTLTVRISDARDHVAQGSGHFVVKAAPRNPPTISCVANSATVMLGQFANITCYCQSPDGSAVTVAWTASAGTISGNGMAATLGTAEIPPGPVRVNATCRDDRDLSATQTITIDVQAPPVASVAGEPACEIEFTNKARPWEVSHAGAACLDDVGLALQNPNAKAVLIGYQEANEWPGTLAAQRAVNAKAYMVSGGAVMGGHQPPVAAGRIELRTGTGGGTKVEVWLMQEGATFETQGTHAVDETKFKPWFDGVNHQASTTKISRTDAQSCSAIAVLVYPKKINLFTFLPDPFKVELLIALRPGPGFSESAASLNLCDLKKQDDCKTVFTSICAGDAALLALGNSDHQVDALRFSGKIAAPIKAMLPAGSDFGLDYPNDDPVDVGPSGSNAWHWNVTPKNDFNGQIRVIVKPTTTGAKALLDQDVRIETPGRLLRGMLVGGGSLSLLFGTAFGFLKWWYNDGRKKKEKPAVQQPVEIHIHVDGREKSPPAPAAEPPPPIIQERESQKKWIN